MNRQLHFKIAVYKINYIRFRYHFAVNPHPFPEIHQMRRCVQPRPVAGTLQNGGKSVGGRAFAVCAGNMYGGIFGMRRAKCLVKTPCSVKSGFVGGSAIALKHGELTEKIFSRLPVCGNSIVLHQ